MNQLATGHLAELLAEHEPPCISLYQPTHRHHPDNEQDPIRFRNLLKAVEASLCRGYPTREVRPLLEPFRALAGDGRFWNHTLDGLAVLGAPGVFRVFGLQRPVAELVIVADSFHIKPLLRILQSADRYQVLCLNRREIRLYEGNRDVLDEVELAAGVPRTISEALGEELTEPHLTVASYGDGSGGPHSAHGQPFITHGHGLRKDEVDIDIGRFFRVIDRAVLEYYSRPSGLPLMLAALPEYHAAFHGVSHNPFLMAEGVELNPGSLTVYRLRKEAWAKAEPHHRARLARLADKFHAARFRQLGSHDLVEVAEAATAGRVDTLLIAADRQIPGRIDRSTGRICSGDLAHSEVDDLLDDLAEAALRAGGQVLVVPADRMPFPSGVAAIYRF